MPSEAAVEQPKPDLGAMPNWDLRDLYSGIADPEIEADLKRLSAEAEAFRERYQGTLGTSDGAGLAKAIKAFEAMEERLDRLSSFAQLNYSCAMGDPEIGQFQQAIRERTTTIRSNLLFFSLELMRLNQAVLDKQLEDPALARFQPWLRDVRAGSSYLLEDNLEALLHEKRVAGRDAWVRLYDETVAGLRFHMRDKQHTMAEILGLMSDHDGGVRRDAAHALGKTLSAHDGTFALITNTLAKDKAIEDNWRGYRRPISSRNLANCVEDEVVDALIGAVRDHYASLSHRYYKLKARWFGRTTLDYWDRNAPLPDADTAPITWAEAQASVLGAYGAFSNDLAAIGQRFFDNSWIDAPSRPGKAAGAFSHPTVPSAHPYLLLNYQGRSRDVMTLAHELGHGVHQILAAEQGHLLSQTPLTLAETASVFGEMLTFQALLAAETDPARRKSMLAGKVEDMLNTVVRQIALHSFEEAVHDRRRDGELTSDQLSGIWMETQTASLGPALRFDEHYRAYWSYIPHFVHVPFYVYAYAFGDCLVNALYAVYQDAGAEFAGKYLEMLRAGGAKRHQELLAPFGLDAGDPAFWGRGLSVIGGMIDELETL